VEGIPDGNEVEVPVRRCESLGCASQEPEPGGVAGPRCLLARDVDHAGLLV
jgi:hypothetical protein